MALEDAGAEELIVCGWDEVFILAYQQMAPPNWWSEHLRFLHPSGEYHVAGEHFYKARWNVPSH